VLCLIVQGAESSSTAENFLQRSPSKRRWIFDSLKSYALFYSGVSEKHVIHVHACCALPTVYFLIIMVAVAVVEAAFADVVAVRVVVVTMLQAWLDHYNTSHFHSVFTLMLTVLCSCLLIVCLICLCTICSFSTLIRLVGSFDL